METKSEVVVAKFPLGRVLITPGIEREVSPLDVIAGLKRHAKGDWGDVPEEDWEENEFSLREGFRLLSAYYGTKGTRFWIITEHDRSATTVLLPEEY